MTPTAQSVLAGTDLTGREAIVTGGAAGIGYQTALALAGAGARVVIASRDRGRGEAAAAELTAEAGGGPVVYRHLDLADLRSVRAWIEGYVSTGRPCHLLIANAAVLGPPLTRTPDGFELQFGTNHLGHFALVTGLLPSLLAAGPGEARVVVLSSSGHRRSDVDLADPNYLHRPYDPWQAYGQSKTANALFAAGFHARWTERGIIANAVMPGGVATGLQRHITPAERVARGWPADPGTAPDGWVTPAEGAATSVWAAAAKELAGVGGTYLEDCAITPAWYGAAADLPPGHHLPYALDPDRADRLWTLSEGLVRA